VAILQIPLGSFTTVRSTSGLINRFRAVIILAPRSLRLRLGRPDLRTFSDRQLFDIGLSKWEIEPWREEPRAEAERLFWL
jgi:uncharacterized protein YjiS (DUF1127 family)